MDEKSRKGPLSGEIVGRWTAQDAPVRPRDTQPEPVLEAEYETIAFEPPGSGAGGRRWPRARETPCTGLDLLQPHRKTAKGETPKGAGPVFWTFGAMLVLGAFWVSGGHSLVSEWRFLHGAGPAPVLRIASLKSHVESRGGSATLFVEGKAVNDGDMTRILPTLSINVLGEDGRTTHYFLGTNDRPLRPGGYFAFSGRLQAPKQGVKSVSATIGELAD